MKLPLAQLLSFSLIGLIACIAQAQDHPVASEPNLDNLEQIVKPPSIGGLAFNGKDVWGFIYHGRGRYSILDSDIQSWRPSDIESHHSAIRVAAGAYGSPGGACFAHDELWIAGSYGNSIACIDTKHWKVIRSFNGKQRDHKASQSYSGIAHDGKHLWVAWHWFNYDLPTSKTQLLLKLDPISGKVVAEYPLPAGKPRDGAHGLAWDGRRLWHIKDTTLSAIDPATGKSTTEYELTLSPIKRPSGLTWVNDALLIADFSGDVWRLPFSTKQPQKPEE